MSHPIVVGAADQKLRMVAFDSASGLVKTDLVAADIDTLVVSRSGSTDVSIASPSDKSNPDDAHSDGDVFNDGGGDYIVDVTDASVASYYPSVRIDGTWSDSGDSTSGILVGYSHPMTVNDPIVARATATALSSMQTDVSAILLDTDSSIPTTLATLATTSSIADLNDIDIAAVQIAALAALVSLGLDHLIAVADDDAPVDNSIIAKIASKTGDWSTHDGADDSLEAISDNQGGGGSTSVEVNIQDIQTE